MSLYNWCGIDMWKSKLIRSTDYLLGILLIIGAIALVRDTYYVGHDITNTIRIINEVLAGHPVYSVSRDQAMTYKYPPWIIPFFFPFALFPINISLLLWGLLEVGSLAFILRWLVKAGCSLRFTLWMSILSWALWVSHNLSGQVVLPMLAFALALFSNTSIWAKVGLFISLSVKIFTVIPILVVWPFKSLRLFFLAFVTIFLLSIPALVTSETKTPFGLLQDWLETSCSGGIHFGEKIRNRDNQGLPALILRLAKVPPTESSADVLAAFICTLVLGSLLLKLSKKFSLEEKFLSWLALCPVIHPLAWLHLFVLAFPLSVIALHSAYQYEGKNHKAVKALAAMGVLFLTVVSRNTFGPVGVWLELASVRSIGTLLCLSSMIIRKSL